MEPDLYLACVADRHVGPEYRLFRDSSDAVLWAKSGFHDTVAHPENIVRLNDIPEPYLVIWRYGEESDGAWIRRIAPPE